MPHDPAAAVLHELALLDQEERKLRDQRGRIDEQLRVITGQQSLARRLLARFEHDDPEAAVADPASPASDGTGPSEAVLDYLRDFPAGVAREQIVEALADRIASKSSNRRRILQNTVINLSTRGKVEITTEPGGREVVRLAGRNGAPHAE